MKKIILIFLLNIPFIFILSQEDTIVNIKGYKIHPEKFNTLSFENLGNGKIAYKSKNHEYYVISSYIENKNTYSIELVNKKGVSIFSFNLDDLQNKSLQNCYISSDGVFIHFDLMTPGFEEIGHQIKTYKNGELIFKKDSIRTYDFNKNTNAIIFFLTGVNGKLFYNNFYTNNIWNKIINNDLIFTNRLSNKGESILVSSTSTDYGLNEKGDILWVKDHAYFSGTLRLSNNGKYILLYELDNIKVYLFNDLKLILSLKNVTDNTGVVKGIECIDEKDIIFISSVEYFKIYKINGKFIKKISSIKHSYFNVDINNNSVDIIIDGKKHHKIKYQE